MEGTKAVPLLLVSVGLLGLAVGSFLNVVIHRVPVGRSIISPGSRCPGCDSPIAARHNIPLVSWAILRGRCAHCEAGISVRYPAVEAVTALLFVLTTLRVAHLDLLPALPAYLVFVAAGIALTAIDLSVLRLPNVITYPTGVAVLVLLGLASLLERTPEPFLRAVVGGVGLGSAFLILAFVKPGGMGLGDVKLATIIGMALGFLSYPALLVGTFAAFVLGAVLGLALIAIRRSAVNRHIPFGPALVAGVLIALFATAPLADLYHSFTFAA